MRYNRLGASGLQVSVFGLGSWVTYGGQVADDVARACILTAYEGGVNFFDNAEAYAGGQAEQVVGGVLKELRRESLVISSKVFWGGDGPNDTGLSAKHVIEACHGALRRLQIDYLDLYYCHRPDPDTPLIETMRAMDLLIRQGKVLYWGTSEWPAALLLEAFALAERSGLVPPTVEQPQYNMFHREGVEVQLAPLVERHGLGLTTWSPLASGLLTGKYNDGYPADSRLGASGMEWLRDGVTPDKISIVRRLQPIARQAGCSLAQLALAWTARNPHVHSVITGASRPGQVTENLAALDLMEQVSDDVFVHLEQILVMAGF